jgi:hypothetical protein
MKIVKKTYKSGKFKGKTFDIVVPSKNEKMVTIPQVEYDLLNYEAGLFYQYSGVQDCTPEEEAKLRRLDKRANP